MFRATIAEIMEQIRFIEELAANAWRPEVEQYLDGWRLRYTQGITRRGNSVLPLVSENNVTLEKKLVLAEEFYSRWGKPPCFQLTRAAQPPGLIEVLNGHSYKDAFHTQVQTAPLGRVLSITSPNPKFKTTLKPELFEDWLDLYVKTSGYDEHSAAIRQGILSRIEPRASFVLLSSDDKPVAVGLGVLERGWVGIYCMVTREEFCRQGAAIHVLYALAEWSQQHKADKMYLQVMEDNTNALALYSKAGFEKLYLYWYSTPM
jgi:ribosomal protein S18 acetylase RimI-like enzyme